MELHEVMFPLRISLVNVSKSAGTCRYLYLKVLYMVSESVYMYDVVSFSSVFYIFLTMKVKSSVGRLRWQNLKTCQVQVPPK